MNSWRFQQAFCPGEATTRKWSHSNGAGHRAGITAPTIQNFSAAQCQQEKSTHSEGPCRRNQQTPLFSAPLFGVLVLPPPFAHHPASMAKAPSSPLLLPDATPLPHNPTTGVILPSAGLDIKCLHKLQNYT